MNRLYSKRVLSPRLVSYPVRFDDVKSVAELDVDQFSGQDFMLNANGFITNDIMQFEECQSDSVARAVLNRLKILHPQCLDQNLTLDQMMASCVPSNYGSPSEFVSAHKNIATRMYKLYEQDLAFYRSELQKRADSAVQNEVSDLNGSIPNPE